MKIIYGNKEGWGINGLNKLKAGLNKHEPFYVQNRENKQGTIKIYKSADRAVSIRVEYSSNGVDWIWSTSPTSTGGITINLPANGKVYLRAKTPYWSHRSVLDDYFNYFIFNGTTVNVGGNIMSLLYGGDFTGNETTFPESDKSACGFDSLFGGQEYSDTNIINAGNLMLPAMELKERCYQRMFFDCRSLLTAPAVLPAPILTYQCYFMMFGACSSLVKAPKLPASTLAFGCYWNMFTYCTSLVKAPDLPATTLDERSYSDMFRHCTSLNEVQCLATDISADLCLNFWLDEVAPNGVLYKDANTTYPSGDHGVPEGWTTIDV